MVTVALTSKQFLSTLPARGATVEGTVGCEFFRDFYPRSPRGERRLPICPSGGGGSISIHAPREGSDPPAPTSTRALPYFYPRSPRGERPRKPDGEGGYTVISIHAPREGSDWRGASASIPAC